MNTLPSDHVQRLKRARLALEGLSVGDAFGGQFFVPANRKLLFGPRREDPPGEWGYTDDTEMALAIHEILDTFGEIRQDQLALLFARRYHNDIYRGYGAGAHQILAAIHRGEPWRKVARESFSGQGSLGNGAAMRVAPVGGYFADDLKRVAEQAELSSEVTHRHPEGIAGGIAIAVATAYAWQIREKLDDEQARFGLFEAVLDHTPEGVTKTGIRLASVLDQNLTIDTAVSALGNGSQITAPDTVPFCLWLAVRHLHNYTEALWNVAKAGGDIDTNGAIVGGIVVMAGDLTNIPEDWRAKREYLKLRLV